MKKAVAYFRVSTDKQHESGLGLEAQKDPVRYYTKARGIELVKEFTEVESGKNNHRPVLQEALAYCAEHKALLIIAKLDRLGRNVAFISSLMESKVEFVAVDNPEATPLILHILAAFAQYEREQISSRTKAALQAAKRRGVLLGKQGHVLAEQNKKEALDFARKTRPIITNLQNKGFHTIRAIARELNRIHIPTFRNNGTKWHVSTVHKIMHMS